MSESIIKMVLDQNWADLTTFVEKRAADKVMARLEDKKQEIVDAMNDSGYDETPQTK